jgi:thiol-disulfide isomerase/thioredoxin
MKAFCMLAFFTVHGSVTAAKQTGPEVGKASPNLIGRTLDGKMYRLSSDKSGPKVINFFWVSCKPCRTELPELAQMEKDNPKVKFISVHTIDEKPEAVQKFINGLEDAPSNIVLTNGGVQENFQYIGLPHTIVLDRNNVVLLSLSGYTKTNTSRLHKILHKISK